MLCTKKPLNPAFSADFALWNISDASLGTKGRSRVILRFNINSFRNSYTISDLLKMDLSIYAIKVGRTSLENLNVNKELGMNVSVIPKDNPSYEPNTDTEESSTTSPILDVFDVLLAGVEAND